MGGFFRIDYDKKRVFGLDALRAFAIFTVMQGHAETFLYDTKMDFFSDLPLPHGVDIFFVLSGFLIGKSFISYLDRNENRLGSTKILTFYAKTALRILPNYYLLLLINYLLVRFQVISGDTTAFPIWRFATFTQDLFTPFWGFYWESWSLPVQWWFYIFFPLLLVILSRFSKPKKYFPWLCLYFVVAHGQHLLWRDGGLDHVLLPETMESTRHHLLHCRCGALHPFACHSTRSRLHLHQLCLSDAFRLGYYLVDSPVVKMENL